MKKRTFNLILSLVFLVAVIIVFFTLWKNNSGTAPSGTGAYITLDVSGVKEEAAALTQGKTNNANIPIPTPTTKLNKANPFANPE